MLCHSTQSNWAAGTLLCDAHSGVQLEEKENLTKYISVDVRGAMHSKAVLPAPVNMGSRKNKSVGLPLDNYISYIHCYSVGPFPVLFGYCLELYCICVFIY